MVRKMSYFFLRSPNSFVSLTFSVESVSTFENTSAISLFPAKSNTPLTPPAIILSLVVDPTAKLSLVVASFEEDEDPGIAEENDIDALDNRLGLVNPAGAAADKTAELSKVSLTAKESRVVIDAPPAPPLVPPSVK